MPDNDYTIHVPIRGRVNRGRVNDSPQISAREFLLQIDAVFDALPQVEAIKWAQYTPYFNDGDECVFAVHEPGVVFEGQDPDNEESFVFEGPNAYVDYTGRHTTHELWLFNEGFNWSNAYDTEDGYRVYRPGSRTFRSRQGWDLKPLYRALRELSKTDRWNTVARTNFGDHAEVTVTRDGFNVEHYDHD